MDTPILDNYIFDSFERIKNININSIQFNISSLDEINETFVSNLFNNPNISFFKKEDSKKGRYTYCLLFKHNSSINGEKYALLLGKISILCSKLNCQLETAGINT